MHLYTLLPYVLFFLLLLFYEGSSTRSLPVDNSISIYQMGGNLEISPGEPNIHFSKSYGITTFTFISKNKLFLSCLGSCNTSIKIPSDTKLEIIGSGSYVMIRDIEHVVVDMSVVDMEIQDPRYLTLRIGKGSLYLDSTHTKVVDAIIGNGHIFSTFTGEYHNIKNLRTLDGDNHVNMFFDEGFSSSD